jgi:hypothetical protein
MSDANTFPLVLETALSSATSRSGDRVVARLAEDVRVAEKVVAAGTEVRGLVTAAASAREGVARLAFDFDALVLQGREHSIGTSPVGIGAADRQSDAVMIGSGFGAAIAAGIAAAKSRAVIGSPLGRGTGILLTNTGREVELGAGTRVTVELTRETSL